MINITAADLELGLASILEEVDTLSADYDDIVREAIDVARQESLFDDEARSLYVRILTILRTAGQSIEPTQSAEDRAENCSRGRRLARRQGISTGDAGRG